MDDVQLGWRERRHARARYAIWGMLAQSAERGEPWVYVLDIWRHTGVNITRVYLTLALMERSGDVLSQWHDQPAPYPRRRQYMVRDGYVRAAGVREEARTDG